MPDDSEKERYAQLEAEALAAAAAATGLVEKAKQELLASHYGSVGSKFKP